RDPAQSAIDPAAAAADVVPVHHLGQRHVAVGVEAPGQLLAVVLEIGLHRKPPTRYRLLTGLGGGAEAVLELGSAAIGGVRDLARDLQTVAWPGAGVVVPPVVAGVALDREQLRCGPTDLVGGGD